MGVGAHAAQCAEATSYSRKDHSCKGVQHGTCMPYGRRLQAGNVNFDGKVAGADQSEGLNSGHEGADEGCGGLLHSQALLALAAVGLPPWPQPLLLQRLHSDDVAARDSCRGGAR